MQEMIALYRLDVVWQQKQREEPKKSPGHPRHNSHQGPPPSAGQETPEPMHGLRLIIKEEAMIISDQPSFPAVAELAKRGLLSQRHGNVTDHVLA